MNNERPMHGTTRAIGCAHLRLGNFGRLLNIPMTWADDVEILNRREAERIARALGGPGGIMHDAENASGDSEIPAAYTFFAQFVDHDITLEARSRLASQPLTIREIEGLPNFRSASLDLDSVYGFGPSVSSLLYEPDDFGRFVVRDTGDLNDVPRHANNTALLGDPRNDENIFLSQMHLLFLRFHNRLLENVNAQDMREMFAAAQREARFHYQWIVLHDFLQRICDERVYNLVLRKILARDAAFFLLQPDASGRIIMPIEFSVAAYRFGHSMVRSQYPVNEANQEIEIFDERFNLLGFEPVPPEFTVDWSFLLEVAEDRDPENSRAIDHLLADELVRLPPLVAGGDARPQDVSLAFRNLLRGYVLGLPSGQRVEAALVARGYPIEIEQDLRLREILAGANLDVESRGRLEQHTPLFLYLMREAGIRGGGNRLGPVGSAILMEVFGAMLVSGDTFLRVDGWTPDPDIARNGDLTLADIVRYVSSQTRRQLSESGSAGL